MWKTKEWKIRTYYTVYCKGEEIIASGSASECAEQMDVKYESFIQIVSKIRNKKIKSSYEIVVEKLNENGDEISSECIGKYEKPKIPTWYNEAERLYKEHKNDTEIARELNLSSPQVWQWRTKNGLPKNSPRGRLRRRGSNGQTI